MVPIGSTILPYLTFSSKDNGPGGNDDKTGIFL